VQFNDSSIIAQKALHIKFLNNSAKNSRLHFCGYLFLCSQYLNYVEQARTFYFKIQIAIACVTDWNNCVDGI
jgi:hypothetical protein